MDFPPDGMSVAASCIGRRRSSCIARRRFSTAASLFPFGSRFVNSLPGDPITDARLRKVDAAYSFASPSPSPTPACLAYSSNLAKYLALPPALVSAEVTAGEIRSYTFRVRVAQTGESGRDIVSVLSGNTVDSSWYCVSLRAYLPARLAVDNGLIQTVLLPGCAGNRMPHVMVGINSVPGLDSWATAAPSLSAMYGHRGLPTLVCVRLRVCLQLRTSDGNAWELQLKGSGITPYSRFADGKAVLRSSLREFVCSEAMAALGVPTTRALALLSTGESVGRDEFYNGQLKVRRVQYVALRGSLITDPVFWRCSGSLGPL